MRAAIHGVLICVAACGSKRDSAPSPSPETGSGSAGVASPATQDGPQLSLTTEPRARLVQGEPLLVRAIVLSPKGTPYTIASAGTAWTDSLALEIAGPAAISPVVATKAEPTLALDADQIGTVGWTVAPDATTALAPGHYVLTGVLDTRKAPSGWKGTRQSVAAIEVVAAPATPTPADVQRGARLTATMHMWRGDAAAAKAAIDTAVAAAPRNGETLALAAAITAETDRAAALALYDRAIAAVPPGGEPPLALLRARDALAAAPE